MANYNVFPVASTTIFPMANDHNGGQLPTEVNLRSRESVAYHSEIPYICGPSYTHSLRDFEVQQSSVNTSKLTITGGSALVHGHFIYLTASTFQVDLASVPSSGSSSDSLANATGQYCVGLIARYSNPNTAAAAMNSTITNQMYTGIQVVVLPKTQFHLPEDPTPNESQVTAHLKLADITLSSGKITAVTTNDHRHECLDGDKISNIEDALNSLNYIKKTGLDPNHLYVMPGRDGVNWLNADDSLVVWDVLPTARSVNDPPKAIWLKDATSNAIVDEATVRYDTEDNQLKMILPHKVNSSADVTYAPKELVLPAANRAKGVGGVLDASWVNFLNGLDNKIATMYRMPGGKMRKFVEVLTSKDQLPKPPIGYYTEQARSAAYYDSRLQYSFNLLQTQVAQLNTKFTNFLSNLESTWKTAVEQDVNEGIQPTINGVNDNLEKVRSSVSNMQKEVADFAGEISTLSGSVVTASDSMKSHLEAYESLKSRVTALETRWSEYLVTSSNTGTEGTRAATDPEPTDYDKTQDVKIDDLENNMQYVLTSVQSVSAKASSAVSQVNATSESLTSSLNSLYQSLYGSGTEGSTGDIKDVLTSVEQLRSQYDYLYDSLHDLYDGITSEVEKVASVLENNIYGKLTSRIESEISNLAEQYNVTANWAPGDYVLVAQDQTVTSASDTVTYPSTMYVVVPGMTPLDSKYVASYFDVYTTDLSKPTGYDDSASNTSIKEEFSNAMDTYKAAVDTLKREVPTQFIYGYELGGNDVVELASEDELPDVYNSSMMLEELYNSNVLIQGVRGTPGKDYFVLRYSYPVGSPSMGYTESGQTYKNVQYQVYRWVSVFFTLNLTSDKVELDVDNPIILSGGVPYAEEERIGGFLNVSSDAYGAGYVSRDDEGHLRLNDFELLAAGVSAYQLGEDRTEGAGLDMTDLQTIFDQYVNQRIAFPNENQLYRAAEKGLRTDVITIDLNIGATSEGQLNIFDIDSRFNTAVNLNITGSSTENVVLNISNCQRLKITLDENSHPTILLNNVCLYYDADIIDRIAQIKNLSLWYSQFEPTDPKLEIDGMTVIYQGKLDPKGTNDFWTRASGNNNQYAYALRQITFASDGTIIGMGLAVTDNTTTNNFPTGESIFASSFTLPQSIGLAYPITKLTKQIKVTGNFVTAYQHFNSSRQVDGYYVKNTNFTALTQKYLQYGAITESVQGVISFYTRASIVLDSQGVAADTLMALSSEYAIDGWESGAYHIFYGGAVE